MEHNNPIPPGQRRPSRGTSWSLDARGRGRYDRPRRTARLRCAVLPASDAQRLHSSSSAHVIRLCLALCPPPPLVAMSNHSIRSAERSSCHSDPLQERCGMTTRRKSNLSPPRQTVAALAALAKRDLMCVRQEVEGPGGCHQSLTGLFFPNVPKLYEDSNKRGPLQSLPNPFWWCFEKVL